MWIEQGFLYNGYILLFLIVVVAGVAQLVVASSLMLKGIGFDPG